MTTHHCIKCGAEMVGKRNVCLNCDDDMPTRFTPDGVPTPPASPTVTETFAAKEACRIVNKFPQIEQMVMAPMLKMEIALALLRAAETKL